MPMDWDKFERDLDAIIESGAQRADKRLASQISSVTRMTDDEVKELFPEPGDARKLAGLMKIVKGADSRNNKINTIVKNAEEFAGIIVTLLEKYI